MPGLGTWEDFAILHYYLPLPARLLSLGVCCGPREAPGRAGWQSCCALLLQLYQNVPLELCSELRPVTSLFVQLQFADKISTVELSSSLSDSSSMISEIISPHKGEINKTLLFDKVSA